MGLKRGQRVRTQHHTYMGPEMLEGTYEGDAPDYRTPTTLDGHSEVIPQKVLYPDGVTHVWPRDAIEPLADDG